MKYFVETLSSLRNTMAAQNLFLFLDYDGTLAPIEDSPEKALLPKTTKKVLEEFTQDPRCRVSIVSGRALSDIKKLIGLEKIAYVGNHGLEIDAPKLDFKGFNLSRTREILEYFKWEINKELIFFKGAFLEDKGFSLSVHYRQLNEDQTEVFKVLLNEITRPFLLRQEIRMGLGKKVFEIKPPIDWDKGKAVLWLRDEYKRHFNMENISSIYIGDDATDEDAFKALKNKGITIKVGAEGNSEAAYFLKQQKEVIALLKDILNSRKETSNL